MGIDISIWISMGQYIPHIRSGEVYDLRLLGGEQFVGEIRRGGRTNPLPSMHSSLQED